MTPVWKLKKGMHTVQFLKIMKRIGLLGYTITISKHRTPKQ